MSFQPGRIVRRDGRTDAELEVLRAAIEHCEIYGSEDIVAAHLHPATRRLLLAVRSYMEWEKPIRFFVEPYELQLGIWDRNKASCLAPVLYIADRYDPAAQIIADRIAAYLNENEKKLPL